MGRSCFPVLFYILVGNNAAEDKSPRRGGELDRHEKTAVDTAKETT